jgi:hypothetical protein
VADSLITNFPAAAAAVAGHEFPSNNAGADEKVTVGQIREFVMKKGADVAAAATVTFGDGNFFRITGSGGPITDIDFTTSFDGRTARVVFDGSPILTNSASLLLPGRQNIQCGPGDSMTVIVDSGDNVVVTQFERAQGLQNANPANTSTANQSPPASATTLLTGTLIDIPNSRVRVGTKFIFHVVAAKTAAGTVAPVFLMKIGTAGTTADGTVLTFTFPAVGTAVADEMDVWIFCEVVSVGAAATIRGRAIVNRRLMTGATGWYSVAGMLRITATAAAFDSTVQNLKASLSLTLGASYVVTIEEASIETQNL